MKIAIVIERADVVLGGAERSVLELATALSSLELDVHILAAKGQTNTKSIHLLCQTVPGKRVSYFTFAKVLKNHLSQNPYDIIQSVLPFNFADLYQPRGGTYAQSILRNTASYRNRLFASYKKITSFANFRRTILLQAERKLCKDPNGPLIAAISQYVADQFKRQYHVDDERIVVVPNGVKVSKQVDTAEADRLRAQILAELNLKEADNPIFFLFVANNFRLKGLTPLIEAMHLTAAKQTTCPACLIVAGRGNSRKYRHLAKRLNVHKKIVFLGKVRHIQNALSITDVAALPTFYDPCSRFILEALAAAKPVITTKFNGATDLFVDGRHGKVIDTPENTQALADAISFFTDVNNIQKASNAVLADNLSEKISITRAAQQLISVYKSIIEKRRQK